MFERSRSLQIYMKPGIKEDDLLLRVWDASRKSNRPQDVFRSMLRAGLISMLESGDMPESIIEECGLDALLERRRRRVQNDTKGHHSPIQMGVPQYPYPQPHLPPFIAPQASQVPSHPLTMTYDTHDAPQQQQPAHPRTSSPDLQRPVAATAPKVEMQKDSTPPQTKKEKYGNMM